jgi:hypothetical protein
MAHPPIGIVGVLRASDRGQEPAANWCGKAARSWSAVRHAEGARSRARHLDCSPSCGSDTGFWSWRLLSRFDIHLRLSVAIGVVHLVSPGGTRTAGQTQPFRKRPYATQHLAPVRFSSRHPRRRAGARGGAGVVRFLSELQPIRVGARRSPLLERAELYAPRATGALRTAGPRPQFDRKVHDHSGQCRAISHSVR